MEKIINHRLYLSGVPTNNDRGIACYSKCLGAFLKCFGFASQLKCGSRVYYVNKKSLKKYHAPVSPSIPLPPRETLISPASSITTKLRENLPEAIQEMHAMCLNQFEKLLQDESHIFTILSAYPEKVQPFYLGLKEGQQKLLLDRLLEKDSIIALKPIIEVLDEEMALQALLRLQYANKKIFTFCTLNIEKDFFPVLLDALNLENFEKITKYSLPPKTIIAILAKNDAKALAFLKSRHDVEELSSCWEHCSPELKAQFWEHLKVNSKDYIKDDLYGKPELAFMKEFLESMHEEDMKKYVKLNSFVFASAHSIRAELFTYLISHLNAHKAGHFITGLWGCLETYLQVEGLSLIYSTLKPSEGDLFYSNQLHGCMSGVLFQMQSPKSWETFLSNTILDYRDGKDGPNTQAFKAFLIIAVINGIKHNAARPLLVTLLKHEELLVGYKILGSEGLHPILSRELGRGEDTVLINLARESSDILKRLLDQFLTKPKVGLTENLT